MAKTMIHGLICKTFELPWARSEENRDLNEIKPKLQRLACKTGSLDGGLDFYKCRGEIERKLAVL